MPKSTCGQRSLNLVKSKNHHYLIYGESSYPTNVSSMADVLQSFDTDPAVDIVVLQLDTTQHSHGKEERRIHIEIYGKS